MEKNLCAEQSIKMSQKFVPLEQNSRTLWTEICDICKAHCNADEVNDHVWVKGLLQFFIGKIKMLLRDELRGRGLEISLT